MNPTFCFWNWKNPWEKKSFKFFIISLTRRSQYPKFLRMSTLSQEDSNSQFGTVRGALFSSQFSCADEEKSQTQGLNTFSIDSNSSNNDGDFKIARALFDSQNTSFFSSSQVNDSQPLLSTSISSGTNKYITPSKHPTDFSQVCCFCCSLLISPSE